jgi:hypothetical protein
VETVNSGLVTVAWFERVLVTVWASSSGALALGILPVAAVGLGVAPPGVSLAREAAQQRGDNGIFNWALAALVGSTLAGGSYL